MNNVCSPLKRAIKFVRFAPSFYFRCFSTSSQRKSLCVFRRALYCHVKIYSLMQRPVVYSVMFFLKVWRKIRLLYLRRVSDRIVFEFGWWIMVSCGPSLCWPEPEKQRPLCRFHLPLCNAMLMRSRHTNGNAPFDHFSTSRWSLCLGTYWFHPNFRFFLIS